MASSLRLLTSALALLLTVPTAPAWGQSSPRVAGPIYHHPHTDGRDHAHPHTHADGLHHVHADPRRSPERAGPPVVVEARGASAEFVVVYDGFPAEARAAFQRAVDLWADHVVSSVPIRVDAVWEGLDSENTLGAAGPFVVRFEEGNTRPPGFDIGVWYPTALANARAGRDLDTGIPDISATFNADFSRWHFGLGAPGSDEFDFTTVVLHELGHGLGFIGALTAEGGTGTLLVNGGRALPFAFDLLAIDCEGNAALDESRYPRPSSALETLLTDEALYIGGSRVEAATSGDTPVPLYAPTSWATGSSYSHLDEATFPNSNEQSLMTPFFNAGERILSPGALTCAVMADMGWELGPACNALVQQQSPVIVDIGGDPCAGTNPPNPSEPPPATPEIFSLNALSPTVLSTSQGTTTLRFSVTFGTDPTLDVFLYDALGKLYLARSFASTLTGDPVDIPLELGGLNLSSGAYFVAFRSGGRQTVKRITVFR